MNIGVIFTVSNLFDYLGYREGVTIYFKNVNFSN